jgi:hypothetical protein
MKIIIALRQRAVAFHQALPCSHFDSLTRQQRGGE